MADLRATLLYSGYRNNNTHLRSVDGNPTDEMCGGKNSSVWKKF